MSTALGEIVRQYSQPLTPEPTSARPSLFPCENIRAVLFDVYGTLLISGSGDIGLSKAEQKAEAVREATSAAGIALNCDPLAAAEILAEEIRGQQDRLRRTGIEYPEVEIREVWRATLRRIGAESTTPEPSDDAVAELALHYEMLANPVWEMPGARQVLAEIHRSGLALGIVSNAQFFTLELFPPLVGGSLEQLGFAPELCFFSYRFRLAKPGRELYDKASVALARRGIAPGATLYIGNDMLNDVTPAASAGFRTALFAGDRRSLRLREGDPRVAGTSADIVLTELSQLRQCLPLKSDAAAN